MSSILPDIDGQNPSDDWQDMPDIAVEIPSDVWSDLPKIETNSNREEDIMAIAIEWRMGEQDQIHFTPVADTPAGTPVALSTNLVVIPMLDIAGGTLGSGATAGHYEGPKGTAAAIAVGTPVYWDATNKVITATATGNTYLGVSTNAAAAADTSVNFQLRQRTLAVA
ncbi:MAG: DUF2190 family protein [Planctomycetaceae bacterium]|jgi:predicted RecA/RadA family phage recombinase|nr:DUF2190 family protein [Planctomycetaceae bacterium]